MFSSCISNGREHSSDRWKNVDVIFISKDAKNKPTSDKLSGLRMEKNFRIAAQRPRTILRPNIMIPGIYFRAQNGRLIRTEERSK